MTGHHHSLREKYTEQFHLSRKQAQDLTEAFLYQLERCKDDASRRILLGVSAHEPQGKGSHQTPDLLSVWRVLRGMPPLHSGRGRRVDFDAPEPHQEQRGWRI